VRSGTTTGSSNLLAAVGRGQLRHFDDRVECRRHINRVYRKRLANVPGIAFMPAADYGDSTFWFTTITVDQAAFGATSEEIRLALEAADIDSRPPWRPLHTQPVYDGCSAQGGAVAEDIFNRGLCLPSGSSLRADDLDRIIETVVARGR
jgi:dTDP-4-amino-4,6-dideoxygalactose transaminase